MKSLSLVFYGKDGDAAKIIAAKIRKDGGSAQLRHAYAFDGTSETCDQAVLLSDVSAFDKDRIVAVYGERVVSVPSDGVALPPPPALLPPDPIAALPADWRTRDALELKSWAASISGRAVDNATQAVEVIDAAIAAKAAAVPPAPVPVPPVPAAV